jgi:hypothetical protein
MAINLADWLDLQREEHSPEVLQDFIAAVLLADRQPLDDLPPSLKHLLGAFLIRTGLSTLQGEALAKGLAAHFEKRPLPQGLVESFQAEFKRMPGKLIVSRTLRG